MAPSHSRQLLVWTLPAAIAALFGYLWYKKKKTGVQSDPGDDDTTAQTVIEKTENIEIRKVDETPASPNRTFSRSLSGVDSQPIDIKLPKELTATKSSTLVISDEDLDHEIEKIKSMKYGRSVSLMRNHLSDANRTTTISSSVTPPENETMAKSTGEKQALPSPSPQKQIVTETVQQQQNEDVSESLAHSHTSDFQEPENIETQKANEQLFADLMKNNSAKSMDSELIVKPVASSNCGDTSNHDSISDEIRSVDSGRGETDHEERPGSTPNIGSPANEKIIVAKPVIRFHFHIPNDLVGKLIGKKGSHVNNIRQKTNCKVSAGTSDPRNMNMTLCFLEGYTDNVQKALRMIRKTFPQKQYKGVTLTEVVPPAPSLSRPDMSMRLMPFVYNYTSIAYTVDPTAIFLYDNLNPEFQRCQRMIMNLNDLYNNIDTPLLDEVQANTLCVVSCNGYWHRAMVLESYESDKKAHVQLVDRGGFELIPHSDMRKINNEFIDWRFLAIQVMLDQIRPKGTPYWLPETADFINSTLMGKTLYTYVSSPHVVMPDDIPAVTILFRDSSSSSKYCNLGAELVTAGLAEFTQYAAAAPAQPAVQPVTQECLQTAAEAPKNLEENHQAVAEAH